MCHAQAMWSLGSLVGTTNYVKNEHGKHIQGAKPSQRYSLNLCIKLLTMCMLGIGSQ